jgi:acyl dehydratase
MTISYDAVNVGDHLPELTSPRITRHVLALFGGASGDHNPMHVDSDFAKKFGMPDVFAHGMLSMAYLAQLLTHWVPQSQLRDWGVRFLSITPLHAEVVCTGTVVEKFEADGERRVKLEINAQTRDGQQTLAGEAVIALF